MFTAVRQAENSGEKEKKRKLNMCREKRMKSLLVYHSK
jgi:hypothetical protein